MGLPLAAATLPHLVAFHPLPGLYHAADMAANRLYLHASVGWPPSQISAYRKLFGKVI
jgi:hypothetical protein